jgi:hypothetical protein
MILHPAIFALLTASLLITAMVLYSSVHAVRILTSWEMESGSEIQLVLERRTYLISTVLTNALIFQALSLALFVYVSDSLHVQIAGAMCAVGTLNANAFGYPVLVLKIVNCLLAGLWLILNHADTRGYDYPLIRRKYAFLMLLTVPLVIEAFLLWFFFLNLRGDVITSCCGSLFSAGESTVSSELAGLPPQPTAIAFFLALALTLALGVWFLRGRGRGYALGLSAGVTFVAALAAIISYFAPCFYELPHHHCPFCILHHEYHYVGYLLYAALFGGVIAGMGCGVLAPLRDVSSLRTTIPVMQRSLAFITLLCYAIFTIIVLLHVWTSDFRVIS